MPPETTKSPGIAGLLLGTGATGLEPATSGVTGRRSNRLSYAPIGRPTRAASASMAAVRGDTSPTSPATPRGADSHTRTRRPAPLKTGRLTGSLCSRDTKLGSGGFCAVQHRGARRPLERAAPQDRHLRVACVRHRRLRARRRRRPAARSTDADTGNGDSQVADAAIDAAGFPDDAAEQVLVQGQGSRQGRRSRLHGRGQGRRRAPEADRARRGRRVPARRGQRGPALQGRPLGARRASRSPATTTRRTTASTRARRHRRRAEGQPGRCASSSSATRPPTRRSPQAFEDDFQRAEVLSLPITLVILVVAFGALVAAGLPLLLA